MRVLVDQCVSRRMVERALRNLADISFVCDVMRGGADPDILERARNQDRILITEGYDFGALIFGEKRRPPPGVIHLFLVGMNKDQRDTRFAVEIDHLPNLAPGNFVVFKRHAPRYRPLPQP